MASRARGQEGQRGQSLVVTALLVLVLALVVLLSFSIGVRTREKVKVQALADSGAYSLAVAEARAFNFYALSNRAIVAHYVSMLSVASHQSYLTFYGDLLAAVAFNHDKLAADLQAQCAEGCACSARACQDARSAQAVAKLYREELWDGADGRRSTPPSSPRSRSGPRTVAPPPR